jgi:hypothetical protein
LVGCDFKPVGLVGCDFKPVGVGLGSAAGEVWMGFKAKLWHVLQTALGALSVFYLVWEYPWVRRFISAVTGYSFLYGEATDPRLGEALRMALNPPPGTALLIALVCGALIYWSTKPRETRMSWPVLGMLASVICFAGFGVWYLVINQTEEHKNQTAGVPPTDAKPTIQVSVDAAKIPAPYYSKTDVDKLLDATREISELLQNAIPVREAAQAFDRTWNEIILAQGNEAARLKLQEIRTGVKSITEQGWAISNKYSHYNKALAPILVGMSFSEKFLANIDSFNRAIEKLRPDVDSGTLSLLEPVRSEYQSGIGTFQTWISGTWDRNGAATSRFRSVTTKADEPNRSTEVKSEPLSAATPPPKITTSPVDVPKKLAAIDTLRQILNDDMPPWINKGQQLTTGAWWNWAVGGQTSQLKDEVRKFYQQGREINEKLDQLQKGNMQFPDIHTLASSPLGTPFLLRVDKFVTPVLALPDGPLTMSNDLYRFLFEPYAKEASETINEIESWRRTTDQNALQLRQKISQ